MKQFILSLLCRIGIHFKEWITIKLTVRINGGPEVLEGFNYYVCPRCNNGHPEITGEY